MDNREYDRKYGEKSKNYINRFIGMLKESKFKEKDILKLKERMTSILNMKTEEIHFIIYMEPKATPRPRVGKFGTFYVKGAKDNSNIFKNFLKTEFPEMNMITTPCKFNVDLYLPIPGGMSRLDKILAELRLIKVISKPDWDNLGKTYSDMVQKHLLQEDSLVYDARVRKFYSSKPRVEITIEYDTMYDSKYSKKTIEGWKTYESKRSTDKEVI